MNPTMISLQPRKIERQKAQAEGPYGGGAYCIRLANDNMPWVGGVSVLGEVNVTHSANEKAHHGNTTALRAADLSIINIADRFSRFSA